MVFCQHCKAPSPDDAVFCSRCGTRLHIATPDATLGEKATSEQDFVLKRAAVARERRRDERDTAKTHH